MDPDLKREDLDENVLKTEEMEIFAEDEKTDAGIVPVNDIDSKPDNNDATNDGVRGYAEEDVKLEDLDEKQTMKDEKHECIKIEETIEYSLEMDDIEVIEGPSYPVKKDEDSEPRLLSKLPRKNHQRLIVEVVVPTWATYLKELREDYRKLIAMKNQPTVKQQKMELSLPSVLDRLKENGISLELYPIDLDIETIEVRVPRNFISATYGGNMQKTFPEIASKFFRIHGMNDFMFLNTDFQVEAPRIPGAAGLFLDTESGWLLNGRQRVFTRINNNEWQFLGFYIVTPCRSLTRAEWNVHARAKPEFAKTWATQICKKGWGINVRCRLTARKELGRKPTTEEWEQVKESGRYKNVTPPEVIDAYQLGIERLGVWTMKCVGYDIPFQLDISNKFRSWVPPPPRQKGKSKKAKVPSAKKGSPRKNPGLKRKRSDWDEEGSSESESELEDSGSESEERSTIIKAKKGKKVKVVAGLGYDSEYRVQSEFVYTPRGTRSRPIEV